MVKNKFKEFNHGLKRKAGRRSPLKDYDSTTKKLYKNPKTGTMYHITELDAFKMKMGLDPNATSIRQSRMQPVSLEEVKPTKVTEILFGGKK